MGKDIMNRYRDIHIEVCINGFIATVGCTRVVAETPTQLLYLFHQYMDNPRRIEKELNENDMRFNSPPTAVPNEVPRPETVGGTANPFDERLRGIDVRQARY